MDANPGGAFVEIGTPSRPARADAAPIVVGGTRWADGLRLEVAGGPRNGVPHGFLDVRVDGKVRWDGPEPDAP